MAPEWRSVLRTLLVLAASLTCLGRGKAEENPTGKAAEPLDASVAKCENSIEPEALKEALRPVCVRTRAADGRGAARSATRSAILVGFVGGFARHDDLKHPEVNFAALFRGSYPSVHADVFANHEGKKALRRVLQLVDSDSDGVLTASEKERANVIIYGHSWGGSQTVALARALGRYGIPVLLTIQMDSVQKPGQEDATIPANVKNAINFYQTKGLIHGRSTIRAADPEKTNVLGNVEMTYRDRQINCANYPWFPRHFNKPHHEIENDPQVWDRVALLVGAEIW